MRTPVRTATVPVTPLNGIESVRGRIRQGRIRWPDPWLMTFLITTLVVLVVVGLTSYFASSGVTDPRRATGNWLSVWNTLLYIPAVAILVWLVHREGLVLGDLVGFDRSRAGRELLLGVGLAVMLLVVGAILELVISRGVFALFGNPSNGTSLAAATTPRPPPFVAALGLLALPLSAGVAEELVYRAYVLPRLWVLASRWPGMLVMAFGFGLQHASSFLWSDWRIALERGLVLFVMGLIMGTLYLKRKRVVPLMVAHTLHDYLGLLLIGPLLTIW